MASMDIVDAKIAAAEARTDTKFTEVLAELKLINQRMDHVEKSTTGLRSNIWGAALAAVGLSVGALAYGGQMFGIGMQASDVAGKAAIDATRPAMDAIQRDNQRQSRQIDRMHSDIQSILKAVQNR